MSLRSALAVAILVTALVLMALVTTRHHHLGGQLEITAEVEGRAPVELAWDSGHGFNRLERTVRVFGRTEPLSDSEHHVVISNQSQPVTPAGDPIVFIQAIRLDDSQQLDLAALARANDFEMTREGLIRLSAGGSSLTLGAEFSTLGVRYVRGPGAGQVGMAVDGESFAFDLRAPALGLVEHRVVDRVLTGSDTRTLPLPRTAIEGLEIRPLDPATPLKIQSARFLLEDQTVVDLQVESAARNGTALRWTGLEIPTRSFSGLLLAVQILTSLCIGGAFFAFLRLPTLVGRPDWRSTGRFFFREEDRWVWWAMFGGSVAIFSFWLAGQWPGAMQNDSFTVWIQLKSLEIDNLRPWPYTLALLMLTQLADSPAVVGVVQSLVSALLSSSIFYYCLRRGVAWPVVALFWLLFNGSIPVGLYNVTHYKDVPFAQCTLLWGFILYYLWLRRTHGQDWEPRVGTIFVLAILLMGFLTRHNGLLFIVLIPVLVLMCRLMSRRRAVLFMAVSGLIFVLLQVGVAHLIGVHARTDYPRLEAWMKTAAVFGLFAHSGGYYTDDPEGDRESVEQMVDPEIIRQEYQRGSFEPIFYRYRLEDADEMYRQIERVFDQRVADNLPILMSDKAYMFTTILGPFRGTYLWSNALEDRRFLESEVYVNRRLVPRWGNMTMLHRLAHRPLWPEAYQLQRQIWVKSREFRGLTDGSFVLWNGMVPFALLVASLLASRWLPATALFALVILVQAPFVFLAATAYSYRFIYFIVYAGYFVIPLALAECSRQEWRRQKSDA